MEDLLEDGIVRKVGGRFKLATLIQKRLIALNQNARPYVDIKTTDKLAIVLAEIAQDKIFLDESGVVQTIDDNQDAADLDDE
jgi:DNA-directed RNA polymerase subunit omega